MYAKKNIRKIIYLKYYVQKEIYAYDMTAGLEQNMCVCAYCKGKCFGIIFSTRTRELQKYCSLAALTPFSSKGQC